MARHRNVRLLSYEEYDDYDDEDDAEQFEEGVLYSATDAHTLSPRGEGNSGPSLRECVTAVRSRLGPEGLKVSVQQIEAALSEAGGDLDIAAAMILSTLKPICVTPPNPPPQDIGKNRLSLPSESSPAVLPLDHQSQREVVNQTVDNPLQNREDSKGGEVPPAATASSQSGQQFSNSTLARKKVLLNQSCDAPTTTSSGITSSSSPTTSGSGRYSNSSPASCEKTYIRPVGGDQSGGVVEEDSAKRERVNVVVIGHVDAGKSTLLGQLLVQCGAVGRRVAEKRALEAREAGKTSFGLAWLVDEDEEERAHGITMEVSEKLVVTPLRSIMFLDAPGHRDFVPSMIGGASMSEVAILVVAATPGEFEAGFEADGQTKEHAILARALGITRLIVAVNKMDGTLPEPWCEERFLIIKNKLGLWLETVAGFKSTRIVYCPVSGLSGENVSCTQKDGKLWSWYSGPTLVQFLEEVPLPRWGRAGAVQGQSPFRMTCTDVSPGNRGTLVVSGQVVQGCLTPGQTVLLLPIGDQAQVVSGTPGMGIPTKGVSKLGDAVRISLRRNDATNSNSRFLPGHCICDPEFPVPVVTHFLAQVATFDSMEAPFVQGTSAYLHAHSIEVPCTISRLVALTLPSGEIIKECPRCVPSGTVVRCILRLDRPTCLEAYHMCRPLGRFILRQNGRTVAAGIVLEIK